MSIAWWHRFSAPTGDMSRRLSEAKTEAERRAALGEAAQRSFERISAALLEAITSAVPTAAVAEGRGWGVRFNQAELRMSTVSQHSHGEWGGSPPPAFNAVCSASLNLKIPSNQYKYEGRSHSLWFGDIQQPGNYSWFETAFMISPLLSQRDGQNPFALQPGAEAARAVNAGFATVELAWPFTLLIVGELDEFIDRWASWFADAIEGRLGPPPSMPERQSAGSWRTS
jgi:hypothetical protein